MKITSKHIIAVAGILVVGVFLLARTKKSQVNPLNPKPEAIEPGFNVIPTWIRPDTQKLPVRIEAPDNDPLNIPMDQDIYIPGSSIGTFFKQEIIKHDPYYITEEWK